MGVWGIPCSGTKPVWLSGCRGYSWEYLQHDPRLNSTPWGKEWCTLQTQQIDGIFHGDHTGCMCTYTYTYIYIYWLLKWAEIHIYIYYTILPKLPSTLRNRIKAKDLRSQTAWNSNQANMFFPRQENVTKHVGLKWTKSRWFVQSLFPYPLGFQFPGLLRCASATGSSCAATGCVSTGKKSHTPEFMAISSGKRPSPVDQGVQYPIDQGTKACVFG